MWSKVKNPGANFCQVAPLCLIKFYEARVNTCSEKKWHWSVPEVMQTNIVAYFFGPPYTHILLLTQTVNVNCSHQQLPNYVTYKREKQLPSCRAGSVWIFQFRFDSVFNLKYSVSFFFDFGIRTPPQCMSILVRENTKRESINFHKKFQIKYIDWPRLVWRSYSSHLGVVNSFTLSVVGPSADLSQLGRI